MSILGERPNTSKVLDTLKDFQRDTVDYVFDRLYGSTAPTRKFLIADEVGLGKTLVARGVIARAIDHLWEKTDRIDVIYICSNADIARQNINRLNVTGTSDCSLPTRITLLPTTLQNLRENPINFVSLTPGTSFDLRSSLGKVEERALLYWLLRDAWGMKGKAPQNVLQGNKSKASFRHWVRNFKDWYEIDAGLAQNFVRALDKHMASEKEEGQPTLRDRFEALCERFAHSRKHVPSDDRYDRACLVGELRTLLAVSCLEALEPDLIILDEFQRFKYLLEGEGELSRLARDLFEYAGARVLLLSATPYKMYTLSHEAEQDDHYADFLRTLRFLQSDQDQTRQFEQLLTEYRRELFRLEKDGERFQTLKQELESRLRAVMVRTERLAVTADRDGMLKEVRSSAVQLDSRDLESYAALQKLGRVLEHSDVMEYWKAAPYLLNFMEGYQLKEAFENIADLPELEAKAAEILAKSQTMLLPWSDISAYRDIDPGNARLRALLADTVAAGAWQLLWMPPSLPYYRLDGPYANPSVGSFTKRLVFSCWRVVPRVVASLVSYEAERRMIRLFEAEPENSPEARKRRRPLLRFARTDGRLTGMPVLGLIYPSVTLARIGDPMALTVKLKPENGLPKAQVLLDSIQAQLQDLLPTIGANSGTGPKDEAWYWAAPILLDLQADPEATRAWWAEQDRADRWAGTASSEEDDDESRWADHVEHARQLLEQKGLFDEQLKLGPPPDDLPLVLAQMALAAPAISALRAIGRVAGGREAWSMPELRDSAAHVGWSFLHLFNLPEVTALIRGINQEEPFWRRVLEYCVAGGLQAVLDEYAHILRESLGLIDKPAPEIARELAEAMRSALTLRTSPLRVDEISAGPSVKKVVLGDRVMRARFALRFGEEKSEDGQPAVRKDQVREAFNSPFWPFVLATTSVGQEGLDFHSYCHAVVHWNLPSNPVDLEQREGRIHRYKGHAVRKNVAAHYGLSVLDDSCDPWESLFLAARRDRADKLSDIVPFWVLEGDARIERHVPALPLSRDLDRLTALRRSLAVYRMVFGQNRQEDLIAYLLGQVSEADLQKVICDLRIDLGPPH